MWALDKRSRLPKVSYLRILMFCQLLFFFNSIYGKPLLECYLFVPGILILYFLYLKMDFFFLFLFLSYFSLRRAS